MFVNKFLFQMQISLMFAVVLFFYSFFFVNELVDLKRLQRRLVSLVNPIHQPLRSGRIWHKVNF